MASEWKYFTLEEFRCKGTSCCHGSALMEADFIDLLDELREELGFPLVVTSGYRCPDHNAKVSSTGRSGPHTTGEAADLAVDRGQAYWTLEAALRIGFTGIGVQQKGGGRFIHLDMLDDAPGQPRPTVWSY